MGATLRELRRRNGLTLVQLAERTDLSHSFLSQIERGLAQPSMSCWPAT
jgi:transcriptional regulator with XRE-family HTH domain